MLISVALLIATAPASPAPTGQRDETLESWAGIQRLTSEWKDCATKTARAWARLPEPAETIADAALAECHGLEKNLKTAIVTSKNVSGQPNFTPVATDQIVEKVRAETRPQLVAAILKLRAAKGSAVRRVTTTAPSANKVAVVAIKPMSEWRRAYIAKHGREPSPSVTAKSKPMSAWRAAYISRHGHEPELAPASTKE